MSHKLKGLIMKRILIATALVVASAGAAMADNFAGYYGNTVVQTAPDGKVTKSKVNADKTYSSVNPDGSTVQTSPAPAAGQGPVCYKIDPRKVGDKWEVATPDGKASVKFELVAG
jgi:Tfp pilus assembly protein PilV